MVIDPAWDAPRRAALGAFCVLLVAALVVGRIRPGWARGAELAAVAAGLAALVFGSLAWGGGALGVAGLLLQLAVLDRGDRRRLRGDDPGPLVPGHAQAARGAAHPPVAHPVRGRRACRSCCSWSGRRPAPGPADVGPFASLVGPWALFVWLRLIVGLVFPLVVSWAAVQTARTRSMESATGLLYINVGTIAAGTILAAGLYFGAGLLV